MLDSGLILREEIRGWSFLGFRGLMILSGSFTLPPVSNQEYVGVVLQIQGSLINCCGVTSNGLTSHQGKSSNTPTL